MSTIQQNSDLGEKQDNIDSILFSINGVQYVKVPINFISYYGIASDGRFMNVTSDSGGMVFEFPFGAEYLYIESNAPVYHQFGFCNKEATLPTIITQGSGRTHYTANTEQGGQIIEIGKELTAACFVGGSIGFGCRNIYALVKFNH